MESGSSSEKLLSTKLKDAPHSRRFYLYIVVNRRFKLRAATQHTPLRAQNSAIRTHTKDNVLPELYTVWTKNGVCLQFCISRFVTATLPYRSQQ